MHLLIKTGHILDLNIDDDDVICIHYVIFFAQNLLAAHCFSPITYHGTSIAGHTYSIAAGGKLSLLILP